MGNSEIRNILDKFPEKTSKKAKDVISCFPNFFTYFDKENMIANAKGYENGFVNDDGELNVEKIKDYRLELKKNKMKSKEFDPTKAKKKKKKKRGFSHTKKKKKKKKKKK